MPSSIKSKFLILSALQLIFVLMLLFSTINFSKNYAYRESQLSKYNEKIDYLKSFKNSFNYMSLLAKEYIVSHDLKTKDLYFYILDIQEGRQPSVENFNDSYADLLLAGMKKSKDDTRDVNFYKLATDFNLSENELNDIKLIKKSADKIQSLESKSISLIDGSNRDKHVDYNAAASMLFSKEYSSYKREVIQSFNRIEDSFDESQTKLLTKINSSINLSRLFFAISFIFMILNLGIIYVYISGGIINAIGKLKDLMQGILSGNDDQEQNKEEEREDEIGEINKAVSEFKNNAYQLKDLNDELEEFSYRTSHDLRSPLLSAIGLIGVAEDSLKDNNISKLTQTLKMLKDSLDKLEHLLQDIITLHKTKTQAEDDTLVELDKLIEDEHNKLSHMANFDKVELVTTFFTPTQLFIKRSRLQLIMSNFISNSIKYCNTEKTRSYLRIKTYEKDSQLIIEFKDNGIGVPEEHRTKIFHMFCRFHPKVAYGSGLGLYMIKKSADFLNAKVSYEPHTEGSVFRLTLPGGGVRE